jgi:hypothetical protein
VFRSGTSDLWISASAGGLIGGAGNDKYNTYPLEITIKGEGLGVFSFPVFANTGLIFVGGPPYFFTFVGRDNFGNSITVGGQRDRVGVRTIPQTVDNIGFRPGPVTVLDNGDGTYQVQVVTVLATTYQLWVTANGIDVFGGPYTFQVQADVLSQQTTCDYPLVRTLSASLVLTSHQGTRVGAQRKHSARRPRLPQTSPSVA